MMKKKHLYIAILSLIILSRFWGIWSDEIQPWDEGIYASRIKACVEYDLWFDQTAYSPKGLYSSAHPPLVIWINALFVKTLGNESYAYRIGTVVFSIGIILLLYFMNENKDRAMISVLIFSLSSFLLFYSQHTQLDVPLAFFILLGLYSWNKFKQTNNNFYLILTGMAFGLGLWTKIIVAVIIPLSIFIDIIYNYFKNKDDIFLQFRHLLLITIIGIILISPWFIIMGMKYGSNFFDYYFVYHTISRSIGGVESNTKSLGILYYINQIAVMLPIGFAFIIIFYKSILRQKENQIFIISLIIQMAIFSIASTKLATYIIPLLVLISYLAGNSFYEDKFNKRLSGLQALIIIFFQVWSYFPVFRRNLTNLDFLNSYVVFFVIILIIGIYIIYTKIKFKNLIVLMFLFSLLSMMFSHNHPERFSGIKEAADYYYKNNLEKIYHIRPVYNSEINNPQITFYFIWMDLKNDENYELIHNIENKVSFDANSMIIIEKGINASDSSIFDNKIRLINNKYYQIYIPDK